MVQVMKQQTKPAASDRRSSVNKAIHTHYCQDCNCRWQCLRVGCVAPDHWMCDYHYDSLDWPIFDPEYEHQLEELRRA